MAYPSTRERLHVAHGINPAPQQGCTFLRPRHPAHVQFSCSHPSCLQQAHPHLDNCYSFFRALLKCHWEMAPLTSAPSSSSVAQSCPTLCDPTGCSTPGFPVHHQLPELAQTPVHWINDATQPSHPLSSPSPPAFNLPQQQGLFKWVSSSYL